MNTKQNQRFLETERKLYETYFRLLQSQSNPISIAAICRESGINRTSFYLHFLDIPDLREKAIRRFLIEDLKNAVKDEELLNFIKSIFCYVKTHQEQYQLLWTEEDTALIQKYTEPLFQKLLPGGRYRNSFLHAGFLKVLPDSLRYGCKEDEAVMTDLVMEWIPRDFDEK